MTTKPLFILLLSIISLPALSQSVAINTDGSAADNSSILDISSNNKGLLVPRMTEAERVAISNPAIGLTVYQTNNTAGFYYNAGTPAIPNWLRMASGNSTWTINSAGFNNNGTFSINTSIPSTITSSNAAWVPGGNTLTATGSLGTASNNHIDLVTNGIVRGRLSNLGEFFIGATNTTLAGDLLNGVSNATFPWATNGYSSFNGGGVYGAIMGGTTKFAGVQGEYNSTSLGNFSTAGVRGIYAGGSTGTGFRVLAASGPHTGVSGVINSTTSTYSFGVYGSTMASTIRTGAVFGDDGGITYGSLGYYASNGSDYSVYGFSSAYQTGVITGRTMEGRIINPMPDPNTQIGIGVYGGVMGGWIRGLAYGMHVRGEKYSMYVDGKTITNEPITQLVATDNGQRIATYSTTSMKSDVYARGNSHLQNGEQYISFDENFKQVISKDPNEIVITVTPNGNSNGVYVVSWDINGFRIKENNNGRSSVAFSWIAIGTRRENNTPEIPAEILAGDFDKKMNGVMFNENNTTDKAQPIWWDGQRIRFDNPPPRKPSTDAYNTQRPQVAPKQQ